MIFEINRRQEHASSHYFRRRHWRPYLPGDYYCPGDCRHRATEFLYVGSKIGLENTLIPKEGLPFVTLDVRGLERKISVRNLVTLGKTQAA